MSIRDHALGHHSATDALESLAVPLELRRDGEDALSGRYRSVPVRVERDGDRLRLRLSIDAPLPPGLTVVSRGGTYEVKGGHPLRVGHAEIDACATVVCAHPAAALRLLREPSLRSPLCALFSEQPVALVGGELTVPLADTSLERVRGALSRATAFVLSLDPVARAQAQARQDAIAQTRAAGAPPLQGKRFVAQETPEQAEERRLLREFQESWRAGLLLTLPFFAVAVATLWFGANGRAGPFEDSAEVVLYGLFMLFGAFSRLRKLYICPLCETPLIRAGGRLTLMPRHCDVCGTRLR